MHGIRMMIGVSVLLTALALVLRSRLMAWLRRSAAYPLTGTAQRLSTVGAGAVLGVLITLSSIGAGAIGATIIFLFYPTLDRMSTRLHSSHSCASSMSTST